MFPKIQSSKKKSLNVAQKSDLGLPSRPPQGAPLCSNLQRKKYFGEFRVAKQAQLVTRATAPCGILPLDSHIGTVLSWISYRGRASLRLKGTEEIT